MKKNKVIKLALLFSILGSGYFLYQSKKAKNEDDISTLFPKPNAEYRNVETKTISPYSQFGDSSVVLTTEQERKGIWEIKNSNPKDEVNKLVFHSKTSILELFDKHGNSISKITLPSDSRSRFLSVDPKSEKYYNLSPYAYVANNPIKYIDPDGREIELGMIYEKDKKGNYKNQNLVNAFEFFAKSEQGVKFLGQFAKKGQIIAGHEYAQNGKFHNAKIDISYQDDRNLTRDGRSGETSGSRVDGRNKVNIELSTGTNERRRDADVETVAHESLIHGRRLANDYYDGGGQNYSIGYDKDLVKHAKKYNAFEHLDHWQERRDNTYQRDALPIMRSYFDQRGQKVSNQSIIEQLNGYVD